MSSPRTPDAIRRRGWGVGDDESIGDWCQSPYDPAPILVGENGNDSGARSGRVHGTKGVSHSSRARRVVRDVENEATLPLKTAGKKHFRECAGYRGKIGTKISAEGVYGRDCYRSVSGLVYPKQRRRHPGFACGAPQGECRPRRRHAHVPDLISLIDVNDRRGSDAPRGADEHASDFDIRLSDHRWCSGFEDARFLHRNFRKCYPEKIGMILGDRCDRSDARQEHIGRVQAPPKSGFDHRNVHVLLGKPGEGERGGQLEEGGAQLFGNWSRAHEKREHALLRNRDTVDAYSLAEVDEMGRCVTPNPVPARSEKRFRRRNHTSLSVRPRDVNGAKREMWRADFGEKGERALQPRLGGARGAGEQSLNRLAVPRQEVVHPAEAGLPLICRSSWPTVRFSSLRGTTLSTIPCSSRNSAVWKPSGSS